MYVYTMEEPMAFFIYSNTLPHVHFTGYLHANELTSRRKKAASLVPPIGDSFYVSQCPTH